MAANAIQWCLYYPGVLNPDELELPADAAPTLEESLKAYRTGDLSQALGLYPAARTPASGAEGVYRAALLLSVGLVPEAEAALAAAESIPGGGTRTRELSAALQSLIASTRGTPFTGRLDPSLSTCRLAESYAHQANRNLEQALISAREAERLAPAFAFARVRVAELEFGFGHRATARTALKPALEQAPSNAQAAALMGFLLAGEDRIAEAESWFDRAVALDSGLANGWLGRGLCRIRRGQVADGTRDLETAAAVEPQRAFLRSYLGKAFSLARRDDLALRELDLARSLDPGDPTAWLYSALIQARRNRPNRAIDELEHAIDLNPNRGVIRSRLLLDQDRAVQGANLAQLYRDAGLTEVSLREASRAVAADYASFNAHLFLANSYDALRDPRQVNLRHETAWLDEYLVANLLAPAGVGVFSPAISQQEYSRLFEQNHVGVVSGTEYFGNGSWREEGVQYGNLGRTSYALEASYATDPGDRPNSATEFTTLTARIKQQLGPADTLYLEAIDYHGSAGDAAPMYDRSAANSGLVQKEKEQPIVVAGLHHEWSQESHTLFLVGRLHDQNRVWNTNLVVPFIQRDFAGNPAFVTWTPYDQRYRNRFEVYTAEIQHPLRIREDTLVVGLRGQAGDFHTLDELRSTDPFPVPIPTQESVRSDQRRASAYAYYFWRVVPELQLIGGVSLDYVTSPEDYRYAPVSASEEVRKRASPKVGFVWTPDARTTFRGGYTRSLGGTSFDQSFQLEPTQVGGVNQAFRSLIPESVAGASAAPTLDVAGLGVEHRLPTRTYLGLSVGWAGSKVARQVGTAEFGPAPFPVLDYYASGTPQTLDFEERSLQITVNQLVGEGGSLGVQYRLGDARLDQAFPQIPAINGFQNEYHWRSTLHELDLYALYVAPWGGFGRFDSLWRSQSNRGYSPDQPGDDFWQFNVRVGYRFPRRQAEVSLGVLNLTGRDYQLNPLNTTSYLWRGRTFTASLRFSF
jgi:tetratricopeptide (TPR) repeat protein